MPRSSGSGTRRLAPKVVGSALERLRLPPLASVCGHSELADSRRRAGFIQNFRRPRTQQCFTAALFTSRCCPPRVSELAQLHGHVHGRVTAGCGWRGGVNGGYGPAVVVMGPEGESSCPLAVAHKDGQRRLDPGAAGYSVYNSMPTN
eukprot:scaffold52141_cov73-Phaeocystis_antarctica.AAC.1